MAEAWLCLCSTWGGGVKCRLIPRLSKNDIENINYISVFIEFMIKLDKLCDCFINVMISSLIPDGQRSLHLHAGGRETIQGGTSQAAS